MVDNADVSFAHCGDVYSCSTTVQTDSVADLDNALDVNYADGATADRNYKYTIYLIDEGGEPIFVSELYPTTAVSRQKFEVKILCLKTSVCLGWHYISVKNSHDGIRQQYDD